MDLHDSDEDIPIFCTRCGAELKAGDFYIVRIEAFADPAPSVITEEDLSRDHRAEIGRLISQMHGMTERELAEQVYRRLILHLCGRCYRQWIENPAR